MYTVKWATIEVVVSLLFTKEHLLCIVKEKFWPVLAKFSRDDYPKMSIRWVDNRFLWGWGYGFEEGWG